MEKLIQKYYQKVDRTQLGKVRSLMDEIDWSNRFIGIKGARGAGKTTLLFQYILIRQLPAKQTCMLAWTTCILPKTAFLDWQSNL